MSARRCCVLLALVGWPVLVCQTAPAATLTGLWEGEYRYPADSGRDPVPFRLALIEEKGQLFGFLRETNTFGKDRAPWLHAVVKGTHDAQSAEVVFGKWYDGTSEIEHGVEYKGTLSEDNKRLRGNWTIPGDWSGTFTLRRSGDPDRETLAVEGVWSGRYEYPKDSGNPPVDFWMVLVGDGKGLVGFLKEPNTFGEDKSPWLHAAVAGEFDRQAEKVVFGKRYDGTSDVSHEVKYRGEARNQEMTGTWDIPGAWSGTFNAHKVPSSRWKDLKLTIRAKDPAAGE